MKRVYLCGHTGSNNRGCEAIVRSTVRILQNAGVEECRLYSYHTENDIRNRLNEAVCVVPYRYSNRLIRGFNKYVLKNPEKTHRDAYRRILRDGHPDCMLCIGGDTYCFARPYANYALNAESHAHGIPTVLWGCSVDERILKNERMKQDIRLYRHIVARESLTYDILRQCITPQQTLWQTCDPAFHLEMTETALPPVFSSGDTVGINISPYFLHSSSADEDRMIYQNVQNLITYLLTQTPYNICFVPHVYEFGTDKEDMAVLKLFYQQYADEPRVAFLNRDLSCTAIKYVISKCRFFIGGRTHSVIAAYSTQVPALALSYSIKSLGIAKDLFGTHEGYTLAKETMACRDCLTDLFVNSIMKQEEAIRARYQAVLPGYKQSITDAARAIFGTSPEPAGDA